MLSFIILCLYLCIYYTLEHTNLDLRLIVLFLYSRAARVLYNLP